MKEHLGYDSPVLYPPVRLERCLADGIDQRDSITLINPVKEKGVQVALAVAKLLPHRRFLFVEAWPLRGEPLDRLVQTLKDLPNVTFRRWSKDIRPVYARTRLLLAPSQWVEAFCTVAFEANANGIPVVASRIGGIPTTVGPGRTAARSARAAGTLGGGRRRAALGCEPLQPAVAAGARQRRTPGVQLGPYRRSFPSNRVRAGRIGARVAADSRKTANRAAWA